MRARPRSVRRQFVDTPDALQRWDRAYQYVLQFVAEQEQGSRVATGSPDAPTTHQEDTHEPRRVCPRVHVSASPDADD